ncbi:hypothetical protein EVAR_25764_1 [Eumeta japonica]|uniref:Uncharacterized protein n=1 Tax=Eumeta variegata TaxID=151549 RepID=A0A4C2A0S1_EUMVA|nr:hypothetical protein EVAR_25764_1 [Eumeta japonica]
MEPLSIYMVLALGTAIAAPSMILWDRPTRIQVKEFASPAPSVTAKAEDRTGVGNIIGDLLARKLQGANGALSQIISSKAIMKSTEIAEKEYKDEAIRSTSMLAETRALTIRASQPQGVSAIVNAGSLFALPVTTQDEAALETEGIPSQGLSVKENLQHFVAGIFQPKPLVDIIREDEKYGNHGDKFYSAGRAFVGGVAGVSNLVNSVLEIPGTIVKQIARSASEKLNNLGQPERNSSLTSRLQNRERGRRWNERGEGEEEKH